MSKNHLMYSVMVVCVCDVGVCHCMVVFDYLCKVNKYIFCIYLHIFTASLAMVLSYTLSPILLIIYIKWRKLHLKTWGGWSFESLTEWWQFMRLGIPGFLTLAFEWWSFEICVLVSGSISELQFTISASILLLLTMYFMVSCYSLSNSLHISPTTFELIRKGGFPGLISKLGTMHKN